MNYMKQVAQMLGVELEEEFKIKGEDGKFKFDTICLKHIINKNAFWYIDFETLYKLLNGKCKIIKLPKPILDDVEKKYLKRIIRPWRDKVKYIEKIECGNNEYIVLVYEEDINVFMPFPSFKKGTMYKGMKSEKKYSLEELGL